MSHMFTALAVSPFVSQRAVIVDATRGVGNRQNLITLTELIEAGKVTPVIDRGYPFKDTQTAVRYQEEGHAPGKVIITL